MTNKSLATRWILTRRELRSRLLSSMFLGSLALTVVVIFAIFGINKLVNQTSPVLLGVVGEAPAGALANLDAIADLQEIEVEVTQYATAPEGKQALEAGDIDGVVAAGQLVMEKADAELISLVTPAWQQATLVNELGGVGLSSSDIGQALAAAGEIEIIELDADPDEANNDNVAFISVILIFISIQLSGAYIMLGVFEEKTTKVIELVLSSARARDLLLAKMAAIGLLGVLQVAVLVVSVLIANPLFGGNDVSISAGLIASGFVWFVLGYMLYGSVFAAGSALAPSQEDAQSTLAPVSLLLMLSYFVTVATAGEPDSGLARFAAWFPFTAPFAMPGRVASGAATWWELGGTVVVTASAAALVFTFAERIYVRSVIHTDRKLGWREAWSLQT